MIVEGRNTIIETLKARRQDIKKLYLDRSAKGEKIDYIILMARKYNIPIKYLQKQDLDKMSKTYEEKNAIIL